MIKLRWAPYRYFPYERELAMRELAALAGAAAVDEGAEVSVPVQLCRAGEAGQILRARATYFSEISVCGSAWEPTDQALVESRHWRLRGGERRRQATRFMIHGLHEYRGKFNPQMARALINVVDPAADLLVDPFCGSGTALVEGMRLGMHVEGRDLSPLAVLMATTKCRVMEQQGLKAVLDVFTTLGTRIVRAMKTAQDEASSAVPPSLPADSVAYLAQWFTGPALAAVFSALTILEGGDRLEHDLARLALSSILRTTSLQMPEDLRVRRRPAGFIAPSLAEAYAQAVERAAQALEEVIALGAGTGTACLRLASTGEPASFAGLAACTGRRLVITSPPYATALPYIDTDRLSLIALGLITPRTARALEVALFGSREWSMSEQARWAERRRTNTDALPAEVTRLLTELDERNAAAGAGFRRAAVPTLLYRYFAQMAHSFAAWRTFLRKGERAALVVGRNRTGPAHTQAVIDTPALLGVVACARGFSFDELINFETYPRYGLHMTNGVTGEGAVVLTRV